MSVFRNIFFIFFLLWKVVSTRDGYFVRGGEVEVKMVRFWVLFLIVNRIVLFIYFMFYRFV